MRDACGSSPSFNRNARARVITNRILCVCVVYIQCSMFVVAVTFSLSERPRQWMQFDSHLLVKTFRDRCIRANERRTSTEASPAAVELWQSTHDILCPYRHYAFHCHQNLRIIVNFSNTDGLWSTITSQVNVRRSRERMIILIYFKFL